MKRRKTVKPREKRISRAKKIGLAPGSVVYTGFKSDRILSIDLLQYDTDSMLETSLKSSLDCYSSMKSGKVNWLTFNGLNHVKEIEAIGLQFEMTLIDIEDLVNTAQRSTMTVGDKYLKTILKLLSFNEDMELKSEHLGMVLCKDSLLMFHESDTEDFGLVKDRIRKANGRIRNRGADYLMFALMDYIVDHYFQVLESLTDKVEILEDRIFQGIGEESLANDIQRLKKEVLRIRRVIKPLNEITGRFVRTEGDLISDQTKVFFKDLQDHVSQVNESLEMNREMIWGLMDMHMTLISNKMNEVMKMLTIIATIFIPLSFFAGIYGMNFENMPELHYKYGYFILLGAMALLILGMIFYFRRKKWL